MKKQLLFPAIILLVALFPLAGQNIGPRFVFGLRGGMTFQDSFFADNYGAAYLYGLDASLQIPLSDSSRFNAIIENNAVFNFTTDEKDASLWNYHLTLVDQTLLGAGFQLGLDSPLMAVAGVNLGLLTGIIFPDEEYFSSLSPALSSQLGIGPYAGLQLKLGNIAVKVGYSWYPDTLLFGWETESDRVNFSNLGVSVGFNMGSSIRKLEEKEKWERLIRYYSYRGNHERVTHFTSIYHAQMIAMGEESLTEGALDEALIYFEKAGLSKEEYLEKAEAFASGNQLNEAVGFFTLAGLSGEEAINTALEHRNNCLKGFWRAADNSILMINNTQIVEGSFSTKLIWNDFLYDNTRINYLAKSLLTDNPIPFEFNDEGYILQKEGHDRQFNIVSLNDSVMILAPEDKPDQTISYTREQQYRELSLLYSDESFTDERKKAIYSDAANNNILTPGLDYFLDRGEVDEAYNLIANSTIQEPYKLYYCLLLSDILDSKLYPYIDAMATYNMALIYLFMAEDYVEFGSRAVLEGDYDKSNFFIDLSNDLMSKFENYSAEARNILSSALMDTSGLNTSEVSRIRDLLNTLEASER